MKFFLSHLSCGLLVLGLLSTAVSADEILKNEDFKKGLSHWVFYAHPKSKAAVKKHVDKGVLTVEILEKPRGATDVQLIQMVTLKEGQKYDFSFDAKQDTDQKKLLIQTSCLQEGKPYKPYGLNKPVKISNKWKSYKLTFTAKGLVEGNLPTMRLFLGTMVGSIQLRNFSLVEHVVEEDKHAGHKH